MNADRGASLPQKRLTSNGYTTRGTRGEAVGDPFKELSVLPPPSTGEDPRDAPVRDTLANTDSLGDIGRSEATAGLAREGDDAVALAATGVADISALDVFALLFRDSCCIATVKEEPRVSMRAETVSHLHTPTK